MTAHWGVDDPAAVEGTDEQKRSGLRPDALPSCSDRLSIFASLPLDKLDRLGLQKRLDDIGNCAQKGEYVEASAALCPRAAGHRASSSAS